MENKIGIMQGRLSPSINNRIQAFPKNNWSDEFEIANSIGFSTLEWVFDSYENPILNPEKLSEIKKISKESSIEINSVCADYFMEKKLFGESEESLNQNLDVLFKLIKNCHEIGIPIVEIPLVDESSISNINDQKDFEINLETITSNIKNYNITIALETDLEPHRLENLISKINHPKIKLNYDVGNSTANKFNMEEEFKLLHKWITNIHIKDRLSGNHTVPLGKGNVNFDYFFKILRQKNYEGDLIIQGAREDLTNNKISPIETSEKYLEFVNQYLDKYQ